MHVRSMQVETCLGRAGNRELGRPAYHSSVPSSVGRGRRFSFGGQVLVGFPMGIRSQVQKPAALWPWLWVAGTCAAAMIALASTIRAAMPAKLHPILGDACARRLAGPREDQCLRGGGRRHASKCQAHLSCLPYTWKEGGIEGRSRGWPGEGGME